MKLKIILERAELHPGVVIMRELGCPNIILDQMPASAVDRLLGHRKKVYYNAFRNSDGSISLREEIPVEEVR